MNEKQRRKAERKVEREAKKEAKRLAQISPFTSQPHLFPTIYPALSTSSPLPLTGSLAPRAAIEIKLPSGSPVTLPGSPITQTESVGPQTESPASRSKLEIKLPSGSLYVPPKEPIVSSLPIHLLGVTTKKNKLMTQEDLEKKERRKKARQDRRLHQAATALALAEGVDISAPILHQKAPVSNPGRRTISTAEVVRVVTKINGFLSGKLSLSQDTHCLDHEAGLTQRTLESDIQQMKLYLRMNRKDFDKNTIADFQREISYATVDLKSLIASRDRLSQRSSNQTQLNQWTSF